MRKGIFLSVLFIFLAGSSFVGGFFVSKTKSRKTSQKIIVNEVKKEESKGVSQNIEIVPSEKATEPELETEKKPEVKFSFAVLGDTQYFNPGGGSYQIAAKSIKSLNPNFVFAVGDLVSSCKKSECEGRYSAWKNIINPLKTYVMQGNHDRTDKEKSDAIWERVFAYLPDNGPEGFKNFVYSFDFENSHFVVLDSDKPHENAINGAQRDWLEKDLSANKKPNVFVFFHEPAYPTNSKMNESLDSDAGERDDLWNILTRHKVKAVFSGHEHIQSRRKVNGIYQFVFGNTDSFDHLAPKPGTAEYSYVGKAFGIVEINGEDITVKTYSIQGNILGSFTLP